MNSNAPSDTDNNARQQAGRIVTVSLLDSFRPLEILVIGASLSGIAGLTLTDALMVRLLALGVVLAGLAALYAALRIRIDARIFAQWDRMVPAELDKALHKINPVFKSGRSLETRLAGAYGLFKAGISLAVAQYILLVLLAWNCA
jgi:hypothetical protein